MYTNINTSNSCSYITHHIFYSTLPPQSHKARDVIIRREDDVAECVTYPDVDRLEKFGKFRYYQLNKYFKYFSLVDFIETIKSLCFIYK